MFQANMKGKYLKTLSENINKKGGEATKSTKRLSARRGMKESQKRTTKGKK